MRNLRFNVAYDGSGYHGWQVQPGLATIQGMLEEVIGEIEDAPVHVAGSGRTDAGVHAIAQVAAVKLQNTIPVDNFRRAVNRRLPRDIRISHVEEADLSFHPRFSARRKTYEYRIFRAEICPPFDRSFVTHHPYPLDEAKMIAAAGLFEGEHDFRAFAASDERDAMNASKRRTIFASGLSRCGDLLIYTVTGSGFLKHMVRNMIGVLFEVGKGNVDNDGVRSRLLGECAILPGPAAPASGLFLVSVEYD